MSNADRQRSLAGLRDLLARRKGLLATVALVAPLIVFIGFARQGTGETSVFALLLLAAVVLVVLLFLSLAFAGVDPEVGDLARKLSSEPLARRLLERWLHRVRWRRWVAGFIGLVAGLFISGSVGEDLGSAAFVYPALAAVCIASISAELYLLRRPSSTRTAELSLRTFGDYANRNDQRAMAAVFAAAVLTLIWTVLADDLTARRWAGTGALVAAISLVAAYVMQRRVVGRSRPAVAASLREADDLLRSLAVSRGIARPALSFALISLGLAFGPTDQEALETLAWILGLGSWWFNRGLGIERFLERRQRGAVVTA